LRQAWATPHMLNAGSTRTTQVSTAKVNIGRLGTVSL